MRIVAGRLGGRVFHEVPGHRTHPMSEKARGALFNALGDIEGLTVLDAYCGTGALSFEAISRGAKSAVALDLDQQAKRTATENAELLGVAEKVQVTKADVLAWSRRHQKEEFDIVILDPPYNAVEPKSLLKLTEHAKKGGLIVLSLPPNNGFSYGSTKHELLLHKKYGDNELYFYRRLV